MEIIEAAVVAANNLDAGDKCPFCYKKPIGHDDTGPKKVSDKVKSVPASLKCDASSWNSGKETKRSQGDLPYTLAQHHVISALQCYGRIRRLVRMGNMVGYDINNPKNGIGLPSTHHTLSYPENGVKKKYGDLDDTVGKKKVADALMKELGAQWHVGHHAFAVVVPKVDVDSFKQGGTDENDENDYPHETQYDILIIERLLELAKSFPEDLCKEENKSDEFKEAMNKISAEIKGKLEKFNGKNGAKPADSSPFFVSMRAYDYSKIADRLPSIDMPGNMTTW